MNNKEKIKRENGTGTVYYDRSKKYRPWVVRVTFEGKRTYLGSYETEEEAWDVLNKHNESPNVMVHYTFLQTFEMWKKTAYRNIGSNTRGNYDAAFKKLSSLHNMRMRDIKAYTLEEVMDQNSDLSSSSLKKMKTVLSKVFEWAEKNDIVTKNYAKFIELAPAEKEERPAFTDIEVRKIAEAADTVPYADVILVMIYTGFRVTEFLSLTRFSYDAEEKTLRGGSKTKAGKNRIVPVHPKIQPYVEKWLAKNGQTIFCRPDGRPFTSDNFRKDYFGKTLKQIGVRELTPHATRHTCATMMSKFGVRPEDSMKILGHASYDVTAEYYIHQDTEALRNAIEKIA